MSEKDLVVKTTLTQIRGTDTVRLTTTFDDGLEASCRLTPEALADLAFAITRLGIKVAGRK